jgi:hypothetical protein
MVLMTAASIKRQTLYNPGSLTGTTLLVPRQSAQVSKDSGALSLDAPALTEPGLYQE